MRIMAFSMNMCISVHSMYVPIHMFCSRISSQLTSYWLFPPYRSEERTGLLHPFLKMRGSRTRTQGQGSNVNILQAKVDLAMTLEGHMFQ